MISNLWMGELNALHEVINLQQKAQEILASPNPVNSERIERSRLHANAGSFDEDEYFAFMTGRSGVQGRTGVIMVSGPMVHEYRWWHEYLGVTSYEAISVAIDAAAMDDSLDTLALRIRSPGGMVSGLDSVTDAVDRFKATGKTLITYTDQIMLSAGYWIGSGGTRVGASRMAKVGSIGVVMTHMSIQRMLSDEGVDVEVFRIGENKARGSKFEALTDEDRNYIMDELKEAYGMFLDQVNAGRAGKVDRSTLPELTEHGKVFSAKVALEKNLIDFIDTFNNVLAFVDENFNNNNQDKVTTIR